MREGLTLHASNVYAPGIRSYWTSVFAELLPKEGCYRCSMDDKK